MPGRIADTEYILPVYKTTKLFRIAMLEQTILEEHSKAQKNKIAAWWAPIKTVLMN